MAVLVLNCLAAFLMTDGVNVTTRRINRQVYANRDHYRHWSDYPFYWWLNRNVRSSERHRWYWTKYSASQADALLDNICDAGNDVSTYSAGGNIPVVSPCVEVGHSNEPRGCCRTSCKC